MCAAGVGDIGIGGRPKSRRRTCSAFLMSSWIIGMARSLTSSRDLVSESAIVSSSNPLFYSVASSPNTNILHFKFITHCISSLFMFVINV